MATLDASGLLFLAVVLVFLIGMATARGATCMVVAVSDIVLRRGPERLLAIGLAALVAAAILSVAIRLGIEVGPPLAPPLGWPVVLGGVLLGVGAFVNRACVFGAVARFGHGEYVYLWTPVGLFAGAWLAYRAAPWLVSPSVAPPAWPVLELAPWVAPLFLAPALLVLFWRRPRGEGFRVSATMATAAIGLLTALLLLFAGPWAYTELLGELARSGMAPGLLVQLLLLLALLAGAKAAGWLASHGGTGAGIRPLGIPASQVLAGSTAMGAGGILVPGANDQLLLYGLPFLAPHALLGLLAMVLAILALLRPAVAARISVG